MHDSATGWYCASIDASRVVPPNLVNEKVRTTYNEMRATGEDLGAGYLVNAISGRTTAME